MFWRNWKTKSTICMQSFTIMRHQHLWSPVGQPTSWAAATQLLLMWKISIFMSSQNKVSFKRLYYYWICFLLSCILHDRFNSFNIFICCLFLETSNTFSEIQLSEQASASSSSAKSYSRNKQPPSGYCAPYTSGLCRRYIIGPTLVYFNYTTDDDGTHIPLNEQITQGLWSELISSLQEPCRSAAETLLCYYAFPQCQWTQGGQPISKPLCKEDCIAVRESLCNREWALLEGKFIWFDALSL